MVNQKTTAVRVIPVEGKGVGEMANFGGLMAMRRSFQSTRPAAKLS